MQQSNYLDIQNDNDDKLYKDTFPFKYVLILASVVHLFTFHFDFLYNLSFILEAIAMIPQIMLVVKYHCRNSKILTYLAGILLSKVLYVVGWM